MRFPKYFCVILGSYSCNLSQNEFPKTFRACNRRVCNSKINRCLGFSRITWAAANGVVTNGGFKGCLDTLRLKTPKSAFSGLFRPFSTCFAPLSRKSEEPSGESRKCQEKKGLCPQTSSDLLKPPFAEPQEISLKQFRLGNSSTDITEEMIPRTFR